jgi:hypothetical protein
MEIDQNLNSSFIKISRTFELLYFQVISVGTVVLIVDKFRCKLLLAISSFLMCISIITLGVFFYLDEHKKCNGTIIKKCEENSNIDPQTVLDIGWLVCLIIYAPGFSLGLGPLPWTVNAEMFPQEAKEKGSLLIAM